MFSSLRSRRYHSAVLLWAILLAAASAAAAQGGRQNPPPRAGRGNQPPRDAAQNDAQPTGTSSIVGAVVVAGSGSPARRARVTISGEALRGGRSATTDDQGRYAFTALPAGRYTLSASKSGHLQVSYGQRVPGSGRPGTPIQLADAQRLIINLQIPKGGVISGTVLDEHGEAVPGTQVRAFVYTMQSGVRTLRQAGSDATDDRGIYRIYGMPIGDYVICATPRMAGPAGPVIDRLQEVVSTLTPQAGPVGQQVAANLAERLNAAQAAQPAAGQDNGVSGYAPVYYPGTTVSANATTVSLNAGDERLGVDFQLQLVAMARVEGLVVYPAAAESGGLQVQLVNVGDDVGDLGNLSTRADREGKFTFSGVAPGQYRVIARTGGPGGFAPMVDDILGGRGGRGGGPGGAGAQPPGGNAPQGGRGQGATSTRLWATADITVDGRPLSNVVLTLQPGFSIAGRLEFRGTAQAPQDLTRVRVVLTPSGTGAPGRTGAAGANGRVEDSGRFTIDGVVPGEYRLSAGGGPGWFIESATLGGQDTADIPVDIRSSQNLSNAVVTFTDQQTMLSGTVTNAQGQAISDYTLVIYPTDQRFWLPQSRRIRSVRPATDGTFSLTGLPAGDYRIAPILDPEPGSWFDPAFLHQLDAASDSVTLSPGEKKTQNVRVGG